MLSFQDYSSFCLYITKKKKIYIATRIHSFKKSNQSIIWFDLISVSRKARFHSQISRGYFTSLVTDNRIIVVTQLIELCRLTRVITRKTIRNGRAVADKHEMHTRRHRGTRCHFYFNRSTDWNKFS